jgi:hypothetical protein
MPFSLLGNFCIVRANPAYLPANCRLHQRRGVTDRIVASLSVPLVGFRRPDFGTDLLDTTSTPVLQRALPGWRFGHRWPTNRADADSARMAFLFPLPELVESQIDHWSCVKREYL